MARRHNTVGYPAPDTSVLNGVGVGRCPGGCGYLATRCGCPDRPRVTLTGRCSVCGYKRATHCTCPGGPRGLS
jgi:hypothetical protein